MTINNEHIPTVALRQRVADLSCAGIPIHLIAEIIDLSIDTVRKHYNRELKTAQAELVEKLTRVVALQAQNGNEKSQALYLKTQGAKFGFVEKQVIEQTDSKETEELRNKIAELENTHDKDY